MLIKKFDIIACVNTNLALGKENELLYHIKSDLQNFKSLTTDNVVVMGRKTFESLPNQSPLPNRFNIIITRNPEYGKETIKNHHNVHVVPSIHDALELCEALYSDKEWFVIGGSSIYEAFLKEDLVSKAYITEVDDSTEGDAYLNGFNREAWNICHQESGLTDGTYNFSYTIYKKKHF